MSPRARGLFVTGTDTGIGKTEVACGLLRAFAAYGQSTVGMKPVAAGARLVRGSLRNTDVEALRSAGNMRVARRLMNPYVFTLPIAPHLAAQCAGIYIEMNKIVHAYRQLAARADVVIVEGVGGFLVPLNERCDSADLARRLNLPVVLVVGMRLGCLSHALLTAAAIAERGLAFAGWFANRVDPVMREYRGNVQALEQRLRAPLLGEIAFRSQSAARRAEVDRAMRRSQSDGCLEAVLCQGRGHSHRA